MTALASQSSPEDVATCHLQSPLFLTQKILEDRGGGESALWSQGDFGEISKGEGCKHAFLSAGQQPPAPAWLSFRLGAC